MSGYKGTKGDIGDVGDVGHTGFVIKGDNAADGGVKGAYGPNGGAYACFEARHAIERVKSAASFVVYDYMPTPLRKLEDDHPLVKAAKALAEFDAAMCHRANEEHNPLMFEIVTGHDLEYDREIMKRKFVNKK